MTCVEGTVGLEVTNSTNGGSQFRIATEQDGGTSYVPLEGEFDLACKQAFNQPLLNVTAQQPAGVIDDLSRLQIRDAHGIEENGRCVCNHAATDQQLTGRIRCEDARHFAVVVRGRGVRAVSVGTRNLPTSWGRPVCS